MNVPTINARSVWFALPRILGMAVLDQCNEEHSSKCVSERGPEQKAANVVDVDALPGERAA